MGMRYKLTKKKLDTISAALSYYIDELEDTGGYESEAREAYKALSWVHQELQRRTHASE